MANVGRKYAEDLVGSLNRDFYNTQRDVTNQTYQTNWESLSNQYKNLQDKLKKQQEEANRDYAKGLVNVAENSYDRMRNANANLVNRGLNTSGLGNLVQQSDTTAKGEEILNLLDKSGDIAVTVAEQLKGGNEKLAQQQANLNQDLGDALGNIGAGETQAQMDYNTGLAGIAGSKDARDMENKLAAMQRAAQAKANSYGDDNEIDKKMEEYQKNKAITSILAGINPEDGSEIGWDDDQKASALKILFGIENANDLVENFNYNTKLGTTKKEYEDKISQFSKQLEKDKDLLDLAQANYDRYMQSGNIFDKNSKDGFANTLANGGSISQFFGGLFGGKSKEDILRELQGAKNQVKITESNLNNAKNKHDMTYRDLERILFK